MAQYKQLVAPRKGTQAGIGWCLQFAQSFFGAPVKYPSAWDAYNATVRKQTGALPTGAAVLVWFSHYGTYQGVYKNWGHVAAYVPGDAYYTSPAYSNYGQERYQTIAAIEKAFNAKYVGWTDNINGLRVAEPVALVANQRQVFSGGPENAATRRAEPTTKSKNLGDPIPPGDIGTFDGWIRGESVSGNNIWFRGISGNWFWSGCFTNPKTTGLKDLNPAPTPTPKANQRQVYPGGQENVLNVRKTATTGATVTKQLQPGTIITPEGWVVGANASGNNIWYKVDGGYAWSGGFTKAGKDGLSEYKVTTPTPTEPQEPAEPDYYDFKAFSDVVTQVLPAHQVNYERGRFPAQQTEVVLHDFGTYGKDTFEGTKSWFRNPKADASAHFVVSGDNIIQMVPLVDRAYHAGPEGNNRVGIEIDPVVGLADDTNPIKVKTIASVNKLLNALATHYGVELIRRKHPDFMQTHCGDDIDLTDYPIQVEEPPVPTPQPEPGDTGGDVDENTEALKGLSALIQKLIDLIKSIFKVG